MNPEVARFIDHARQKGMDPATIRVLLLSAGWKERDVAKVLAEQVLDIEIPVPPDTGGAREAFFHLLSFASLYTSAIGVAVLFFQFIDRLFPDPAFAETIRSDRFEVSAIRWRLAVVLVAFPAFLWLSRFVIREIRAKPERSWSGIRRWLTYLTLFFAVVALGCDVVALLFRLLEGEITVRFLAKVAVVLVIAMLALAYYLSTLRLAPRSPEIARIHGTFAIAAGSIVAIAVVWGFVVVGSPATERLRKLDDRRVDDLEGIRTAIVHISVGDAEGVAETDRKMSRPLPRTLEEVVAGAKARRPFIRDPQSGDPYGYEVVSDRRFRLCAAFVMPRDENHAAVWNHPAGRHCFEFDVLESD